jgi:hypothetical protein
MRRLGALAIAAVLVLLILDEVYLVRVTRLCRQPRLELGRRKVSRLQEGTRQVLAGLRDDVFITYYATDRAHMPSRMRRVEEGVTDLLEALKAASNGRLGYQIVDPPDVKAEAPRKVGPDGREEPSDLDRYASRRGVAPFHSRSIERDAWSERIIWSSLTIAYGPRLEVAINGIGPEHIPRLQGLIAEYLRQLAAVPPGSSRWTTVARKPVVALCAPPDTKGFQAALSEKAVVIPVDIASGAPLPLEADLLFWIDPREASPSVLREIGAFLDRGRSVVVAGSEREASVGEAAGSPVLELRPTGYPAEGLLADFGLRPVRGLVIDKSAGELTVKGEARSVPFLLRCNPYNQNFRGLRTQPNGNLLFLAPTPIALDGETLAERGWTAQVLAASSENTTVLPIPDRSIPLEELAPGVGEPAPKLAIGVLLKPGDPWKGSFAAFGSSTPFRDSHFAERGTAHPRLLQALLEDLAPPERLVLNRAGVARPEPIPELSWSARLFWRGACVFLLPAVFLALAAYRGAFRRGASPAPRSRGTAGLILRGVAGLAAALLLARLAGAAGLRLDLTKEGLNRLAPETRSIARSMGEEPIRAELFFSPRDRLPPAMRPHVKRLQGTLRDLRRAGARISTVFATPEDLDPGARDRLAREGIEPSKVTTRDEEQTTVRTVYGALRLSTRGRTEVLRFPGPASFENLEFRLAFALRRLETGRRPHVGFASDNPRLSPAEAYEYYQQQNLFAPMGTDVYSLARELLEGCDFRVTHINSREPVFPDDLDILVCLQPRKPVEKLFTGITRCLHEGRPVLLAAQHFNIQSRQYRGTGFKIVHWPQPQMPDVERYYFPDVGIDLVRQVLFDDLKTAIVMDAQINRASVKPEFERQDSALPFLVRASAANFAPGSTVTAGLGDQAFIWGAFIRWDETKLTANGIRATPLMTTSARSWSFAWKGGWLPDEILAGPAPAKEGSSPGYLGKLPLAVLFEGKFPYKEISRDGDAKPAAPTGAGNVPPAPPVPPPAEGPSGAKGPAGEPPSPETPAAPSAPGPAPVSSLDATPVAPAAPSTAAPPAPPAPPPPPPPPPEGPPRGSRLLLIGCSEMFKNHRLLNPEFRADHLLLNSVTALALEPGLAAIAARRPIPRGLDLVDPGTKLRWRIIVISAGPAVLLLIGIARWVAARRGSRPAPARAASEPAAARRT